MQVHHFSLASYACDLDKFIFQVLRFLLIQEVLFEPNTYTCESRHNNLIAFQFEVGLLRRVLQAAGANDADSLEVSTSARLYLGEYHVVLCFTTHQEDFMHPKICDLRLSVRR